MYPETQSVSFVEAVKLYFARFTDFSTRSRRSEYWWVCLFNMIVGFIIGAVIPDLAFVWSLVTIVPTLALCIRRLHDIGKSGWSYLLILIPLVGSIILIIWFCQDSGPDNRWGPNPKAPRYRHDNYNY